MAGFPETRLSLIARIQTGADSSAWAEFVAIYWPVIFRSARQKGLQHADAEDLAQQVLLAVSKAVERWQPDEARAKFRTWLGRIAENLTLNALTRRRPDCGIGDSANDYLLDGQPAPSVEDSGLIRLEYRREIFHWASQQIRGEFQSETWQAFWLSTVQDLDLEAVAKILGKNIGSIYAARSRVMKRLKEKVLEWVE